MKLADVEVRAGHFVLRNTEAFGAARVIRSIKTALPDDLMENIQSRQSLTITHSQMRL